MKKIFVSDFDGTATALDFYKIVLNKIGDEGWHFVDTYRKTGKVDYHFLNKIFGWQPFTDEDYKGLIENIDLDETLRPFLAYLRVEAIDFTFVSAGFDRYIYDVLQKKGYNDVQVITNPGFFKEGVLGMTPDKGSPYYSELFGIDKSMVINDIKKEYDKIYFAGDTEPDLGAALVADVVFAKGELIPLLEAHKKAYKVFETYEEIIKYLKAGV